MVWPFDAYIYAPQPQIPPLPPADFAVFADEPGSITSASGVVSAWGSLAQATSGNRPLLVTDTVTGQQAIRFSPGKTLALGDGTADFLSQEACVVVVVWRSRNWDPRRVTPFLDTSDAGAASAGFQMQISDDSTNNGRYRKVRARVWDGASWIIDEPPSVGFYNNNFIEGKWVISVMAVTSTLAMVAVDGETAYSFTEAVSLPSATPSPLVVGDGDYDVACIYLRRGALTPSLLTDILDNLAPRFDVDLLSQVVGSPTTVAYYAFPGLTKLTTGTLVTCYRAGSMHSGDIGSIDLKRSTDRGRNWGAAQTIVLDTVLDSRDPSLSKELLDGSFLLNYFVQTIGPNGLEESFVIRSTTDTNTWGSPVRVTVGNTITSTGFEACSAPIVQRANGNLLFPLYGKTDGATHTSAWVVLSTDGGATWPTNVQFADGVADGISYSEPGFLIIHTAHQGLNVGDVLALVRDDTAGNQMWEFVSTDGGVSFGTGTAVPGAHSSGRSLTQLASGEIVWCGRPNDPAASLMRRTGAGTWATGQVIGATPLGVLDAAMTYAGLVETSPGIMTIVYGREEAGPPTQIADIVCRPDFPEWQLLAEMPMTVTPLTASVNAGEQVQITANGAGPFTYPFSATGSGSPTCNAAGLYTAGASTGSDVVDVTDLNDQIIPVTISVTGSSITPPTGIDSGNLTVWWDSGQNITVDGGGDVATWTSADASALVASGAGSPPPNPITGPPSHVDFNGTGNYCQNVTATISDLLGSASWTIGVAWKDTGSIADTGNYFTNAAIIGSINDGVFAMGTTATQIYAGQGDTGAGSTYDIVSASAGNAHYGVIHYDAGAGKIAISVDGGSFSAGTTVGALGTSVQALDIGRSGVVGAFFNGSLYQLCIWKALETGANLTAINAFLASKIT